MQIQNTTIKMKTRESRKTALKEDIKYIFEELLRIEEEEHSTKSLLENAWKQETFKRWCDSLSQTFIIFHVESTTTLSSSSKSMK